MYLFLEIKEGREKERGRYTNVRDTEWLPLAPPQPGTGCSPGMCPDKESNQRHFALQDNGQPTEPY